MRFRYLGHSCVEVVGQTHIVIDPDFVQSPEPNVDTICVTHAHTDHIGRIAELKSGILLASADVCEIAAEMGVPRSRLQPVKAGDTVGNIRILPGYSIVGGFKYTLMKLMFKGHLPERGGTPLSFLVDDGCPLLHIGDGHLAPEGVRPDVLCLPWRRIPRGAESYQATMIALAQQVGAPYVLPVHHDMPPFDADPRELIGRLDAHVLCGDDWHEITPLSR